MPNNLTDVNAWTTPVVAPADGDPENAASIIQGLQPLANRTFWIKSLIGVASGIATLDATARVASANVRNGIIGYAIATLGTFSTSSITAVDMGCNCTLTTNPGDIVLVFLNVQIAPASGEDIYAQVVANGNGSSFAAVGNMNVGTSSTGGLNCASVGLVAMSGANNQATTIKAQAYTSSGASGTISSTNLFALQFRP